MKTIKKTIFSIFMLTTVVWAQAQSWKEGYIVPFNKDTLYGELQLYENTGGCSFVNFWNYAGHPGNEQKYCPDQLLAFKYGDEILESKTVNNSRVFMRRLVNGALKLYLYSYDSRDIGGPSYTHTTREQIYFLEGENGELTRVKRFGFKKAMKEYVKDCAGIAQKVNDGNYKYKDLQHLAEDYNQFLKVKSITATNN